MSKYKNKKTVYKGLKFDSIVEKDYYIKLKKDEDNGLIKDLDTQKTFILQPSFKLGNKTIRAITYKADFYYITKEGQKTVIDVKGAILTTEFKIKLKMMRYIYKDIDFILIAKRNGQWVNFEEYTAQERAKKRDKKKRK